MNRDNIKITYPPEKDGFFNDLKKEVDSYFISNNISIYGNRLMYIKIILLFTVYILIYFIPFLFKISQNQFFICYIFLGIWSLFLGVNIGHDAAHNALFKNTKYNKLFMHIFDFLGLSSFNWKNRHVKGHHKYSNIMHYDPDIQQSLVVKIFPQDKHKKYHRFQWLYMPLIYSIFIPRWIFYRDFKDIFFKKIGGFYNHPFPINEILKMIIFKTSYVTYLVLIPYCILHYELIICVWAFLMLMISSSLTIAVVILTSHMLENSKFLEPNNNGEMPYSWSKHQLLTTSDYATNSFVITHLFGGFNHHVIHHLFQHICHIHYPALTKILQKVAYKHHITYQSHRYILPAILSHLKLLYKNGRISRIE